MTHMIHSDPTIRIEDGGISMQVYADNGGIGISAPSKFFSSEEAKISITIGGKSTEDESPPSAEYGTASVSLTIDQARELAEKILEVSEEEPYVVVDEEV